MTRKDFCLPFYFHNAQTSSHPQSNGPLMMSISCYLEPVNKLCHMARGHEGCRWIDLGLGRLCLILALQKPFGTYDLQKYKTNLCYFKTLNLWYFFFFCISKKQTDKNEYRSLLFSTYDSSGKLPTFDLEFSFSCSSPFFQTPGAGSLRLLRLQNDLPYGRLKGTTIMRPFKGDHTGFVLFL